ncbi:phage tail protein [Salinivibrio sp. KP-1]|uniref:phage tail-collar fiber domain-containing protein n=2 Tax=unclassified Salinivibrio TaxID=2636825 RepID=UPI0009E3EA50|nr:phage tail protein [Salinivibrio sp. KP-1]
MSQTAIPLEFEKYLQNKTSLNKPTDLNEVVFAMIPDLDPSAPIDRNSSLPPVGQWVYQQDVDQIGKSGDNAVVYSVVIPGTVAPFQFNAMFLRDKNVPESCGVIVHKATETKEVGMALTKSLMMQFDGAAAAGNVTIDAETWQIDYSARLRGMDEDLRLVNLDNYGHTAFVDGFAVTRHDVDANKYLIAPGVVYIGGLRVALNDTLVQTVADKPKTLYIDAYRDGTALSDWENLFDIVASNDELTDYTAQNGRPHYVTKLARINSDGSIEDLRQRGGLQAHLDAEDPHSQYIPKSAIATIEEAKQGKKGKMTDAEGVHAAFNQYGLGSSEFNENILSYKSLTNPKPTGFYRYADNCTNKPSSTNGEVIWINRSAGTQSAVTIDENGNAFFGRESTPGFWIKITSENDKANTAELLQGTNDKRYVTSKGVNDALDMVGFVLWSSGKQKPKGRWIKPARVELSRTAYAELWQFAQDSGTLVDESLKDQDPETYAPCYGTGDGSSTFTTPDYRGDFFRVADDGRGVDAGRESGTFQSDELKEHNHDYRMYGLSDFDPTGGRKIVGGDTNGTDRGEYRVDNFGGSETRPRNVALVAWLRY